jgi:membrane fusion protein (multidrug efflux system)
MRFTLGLAAVALIASACAREEAKKGAAPPPEVEVEAVTRADVPLFMEAVASIDGYVNADIRARVRGYLRSQNYRDGSFVKEGDLLFTIEATEFQSQVMSAKAALSRAKAAKDLADVELVRVRALRAENAVAQAQVDTATAQAADTEGQVHAAEAALEQAQLSLSYTQIRSPVTGVAGLAQVRIGNLVGQSEPTLLATVSQVDPMRVRFPIAEADYLKQYETMKTLTGRDIKWATVELVKAGHDDDVSAPQLVLLDGSVYPHRGVLIAVDRNVDTTTGTLQVEALFPNRDAFLKPGQFGRVRVRRVDAGTNVVVVSQKALIEVQGAYTVAVVGEGNKVSMRKVDVGPAAGERRIVTSGLEENERVVVAGLQKVRDGTVVAPKEASAATASTTQR